MDSLMNLKSNTDGFREDLVRKVLYLTNWNITKAAKLLGVSRPTVYDDIKKYRLVRPL